MYAFGRAFCQNLWPSMKPHNYCRASISRRVKHCPVLLSHNDSAGTRNDWTTWPVKAFTQYF
jgi:hypothetical protein